MNPAVCYPNLFPYTFPWPTLISADCSFVVCADPHRIHCTVDTFARKHCTMMTFKTIIVALALADLATANLRASTLKFSEVFPRPNSDRDAFIELYNPMGKTADASSYKVCRDLGQSQCTQLGGSMASASYYLLCRDISVHMSCRMATDLNIRSNIYNQLFLYTTDGSLVDSVSWSNDDNGNTYVRGINADPLFFHWTSPATPGTGFLGGESPSVATPSPVNAVTPSPVNPITPSPINAVTPSPVNVTPSPIVAPVLTPTFVVSTNECVTGGQNCHRFADCTESTSGFACVCRSGFQGDGITCTDINGKCKERVA